MLVSDTSHASHKNLRLVGLLQVSTAGFCFGFLGVFGRLAHQQNISIGELLSFRFLTAFIFLALLLAVFSPKRLKISTDQLLVCAGLGVLGYAVFSTLYFISINGLTIAMASLLLYTYPLFVTVGAAIIFKERATKIQLLAIPILIAGLILLLSGRDGLSVGGNRAAIFAGLGAALSYSLYILASSHWQKSIDPLTSGVYVIAFAAMGLIAIHQPDFSRASHYSFNQIAIIIGIALVCTVSPLVLFLSGLQKLGNTESSLLSTVEPVTAAAMGSLIFNEVLHTSEMLGGGLVICALIATALGSRKP